MMKELNAKQRLDEQTMALRVAKEFEDGTVINLGIGIPSLAANFISLEREFVLHTENGVLGYGPIATSPEEEDFDLVNAGGQFLTRQPGMCFFDHAESFALIRGGHIDLCVMGAFQVSEKGDLANWLIPGKKVGNIGGSMDLAFGARKLIVCMTHTTSDGRPKIVKECSYELTAPKCVDLIITDIAVMEVTIKGLQLREFAPGWKVEEIQELTEPKLILSRDLKEMELM